MSEHGAGTSWRPIEEIAADAQMAGGAPEKKLLALARGVLLEWDFERDYDISDDDMDALIGGIAAALASVAAEEREACAKLVEDHGHSNGRIRASHKHLAQAIRHRAGAGPKVRPS